MDSNANGECGVESLRRVSPDPDQIALDSFCQTVYSIPDWKSVADPSLRAGGNGTQKLVRKSIVLQRQATP